MNDIFPESGRPGREILDDIRRMKQSDSRWDEGRMFAFVYTPGPEAVELMLETSKLYFFENALSPSYFPSLAWLESEVVAMAAGLLHGNSQVAGNITSGGTESILMAVKTARDLAFRKNTGIPDMEIILPWSAHPAFHKAAQILSLKAITLPLDSDYRADISLLPGLINKNTIMMVGSAPSYAHGVIDPIMEMGNLAEKHRIYFHVDACLGGFFLPFMEKLGYTIPNFDFRVRGVTSISADLHKYGYGAKGASLILYRNRSIRKAQFFAHSDWPGGPYGSTTLSGSRSGVPIAIAWAMLNYYGMSGYVELTRKTMEAAEKFKKGISAIEGLEIPGNPTMSVFSFTSDDIDIFGVNQELRRRGWCLDSIMVPRALHFILTCRNLEHVDEFLADLEQAVATVRSRDSSRQGSSVIGQRFLTMILNGFPKFITRVMGMSAARSVFKKHSASGPGEAVFYGILASVDDKTNLDRLVRNYLDRIYMKR